MVQGKKKKRKRTKSETLHEGKLMQLWIKVSLVNAGGLLLKLCRKLLLVDTQKPAFFYFDGNSEENSLKR